MLAEDSDRYVGKLKSLLFNLRSSAELRGQVISGGLSAQELCRAASHAMASTSAVAARASALTDAAAAVTVASEDMEVVVQKKEGGTKMEWFGANDEENKFAVDAQWRIEQQAASESSSAKGRAVAPGADASAGGRPTKRKRAMGVYLRTFYTARAGDQSTPEDEDSGEELAGLLALEDRWRGTAPRSAAALTAARRRSVAAAVKTPAATPPPQCVARLEPNHDQASAPAAGRDLKAEVAKAVSKHLSRHCRVGGGLIKSKAEFKALCRTLTHDVVSEPQTPGALKGAAQRAVAAAVAQLEAGRGET